MMDNYVASRAYVDIMLMLCNCIMLFYCDSASFALKFNQTLIELEQLLVESWCHHIELTSATTLTFMGRS